MKRAEEISRTMDAIVKEIKDFGKFKHRKGSVVYDKAVTRLSKHKIIIQSRRTIPNYWYPGENYKKARILGPGNFIRTTIKKSNFLLLLEKWFKKNKQEGIFFLLGLILGGLIGWLVM